MCHQVTVAPRNGRIHTMLILVLALLVPVSVQVSAQESPPGAGVGPGMTTTRVTDEQVIVRGQRLSEVEFNIRAYVREFVAEVAAPAQGRGLARWHDSVCIGVNNLERNAAQYIVDRISYQATEVGLDIGEPGCQPDVVIIFAANAKELATFLVEKTRGAFRPSASVGSMSRSRKALEEFAQTDRAVRWWHVSTPVSAINGQRAVHLPSVDGFRMFPWVNVNGPSRLHSGIIDTMSSVIIIVDGTKLAGTSWQEIGDYLAVVSLAQIDLTADPMAFDSILNLFNNPAAYSGLTDWDRSYLNALYSVSLERLPQLQINAVVSKIARQERVVAE